MADGAFLAGTAPAPVDRLERAPLAHQGHYLGFVQHLDIGLRADPLDEIARHRLVEAGTPHEEVNLRRLCREIDRGLSRGVAGANEGYLLLRAQPPLER